MTLRKSPRGRKSTTVLSSVDVKLVPQRHGAITRNLPSYASYKRWSDQMKNGWRPVEEPER